MSTTQMEMSKEAADENDAPKTDEPPSKKQRNSSPVFNRSENTEILALTPDQDGSWRNSSKKEIWKQLKSHLESGSAGDADDILMIGESESFLNYALFQLTERPYPLLFLTRQAKKTLRDILFLTFKWRGTHLKANGMTELCDSEELKNKYTVLNGAKHVGKSTFLRITMFYAAIGHLMCFARATNPTARINGCECTAYQDFVSAGIRAGDGDIAEPLYFQIIYHCIATMVDTFTTLRWYCIHCAATADRYGTKDSPLKEIQLRDGILQLRTCKNDLEGLGKINNRLDDLLGDKTYQRQDPQEEHYIPNELLCIDFVTAGASIESTPSTSSTSSPVLETAPGNPADNSAAVGKRVQQVPNAMWKRGCCSPMHNLDLGMDCIFASSSNGANLFLKSFERTVVPLHATVEDRSIGQYMKSRTRQASIKFKTGSGKHFSRCKCLSIFCEIWSTCSFIEDDMDRFLKPAITSFIRGSRNPFDEIDERYKFHEKMKLTMINLLTSRIVNCLEVICTKIGCSGCAEILLLCDNLYALLKKGTGRTCTTLEDDHLCSCTNNVPTAAAAAGYSDFACNGKYRKMFIQQIATECAELFVKDDMVNSMQKNKGVPVLRTPDIQFPIITNDNDSARHLQSSHSYMAPFINGVCKYQAIPDWVAFYQQSMDNVLVMKFRTQAFENAVFKHVIHTHHYSKEMTNQEQQTGYLTALRTCGQETPAAVRGWMLEKYYKCFLSSKLEFKDLISLFKRKMTLTDGEPTTPSLLHEPPSPSLLHVIRPRRYKSGRTWFNSSGRDLKQNIEISEQQRKAFSEYLNRPWNLSVSDICSSINRNNRPITDFPIAITEFKFDDDTLYFGPDSLPGFDGCIATTRTSSDGSQQDLYLFQVTLAKKRNPHEDGKKCAYSLRNVLKSVSNDGTITPLTNTRVHLLYCFLDMPLGDFSAPFIVAPRIQGL